MKKSIFSIGAAALALAMFVTACSSSSDGFVGEVAKAQKVVDEARGLENHDKLPAKYLLPNSFLENTKVLYIDWAATATDAIEVRFGEADVISVGRDAMDSSNLKAWDAMRSNSADKTQAEAALKKIIAESYAKNKTTSKLNDEEMFATVVGKIAQEDYLAYKSALKDGAQEADYADQTAWLEKGKANVSKVAAEQKKVLEAAEKRLAQAEKDAEEANRKIKLTIQYYSAKGAYIVAEKTEKESSNQFLAEAAKKAKATAKETMDSIEKEFPEVLTVFEMPPINVATLEDAKNTSAAIAKELAPWKYALEVGGKRWTSYWDVKKWAKEAQKTLEEVSGE